MGRSHSSASTISRELLRLLPPDGSPIPNRAALALLSKRLGAAISNDDYFAARDVLLTDKLVGRVRGQGGSVYLIGDAQPSLRKEGEGDSVDAGPPELTAHFDEVRAAAPGQAVLQLVARLRRVARPGDRARRRCRPPASRRA